MNKLSLMYPCDSIDIVHAFMHLMQCNAMQAGDTLLVAAVKINNIGFIKAAIAFGINVEDKATVYM